MARRRQPQQRARPASEQRRANWWALPAFLAAVFGFKLLVLTQLQDHPLLQPEGALDAAAYVALAHRVTAGDVLLGPGLYYVSPLYIYFLAALFSISDSLVFVRVVQLALGTAAVGCVFVATRTWFGVRAAWFSAVLTAFTGLFTFYEIVLFQSSLDVFLTSAGLACLSGVFRLKPEATNTPVASTFRWKVLLAGVFFGLQILNRPNITIAVAGIAVALLVMHHRRAAALFAAAVALTLAPVVARNLVVSKQFALASSQGGLNFYIGNNAAATGQYVAVPGIRANIEGQAEDTRRVAEAAEGRQLSDGEVSGHFRRLATSWIRQQPVAAATLFLKKLALVFNARHQWLDYSYPYYAHDTGSMLWLLFVGPWLLVPLGLAGFAFGSRGSRGSRGSQGSPGSWVLATFVACYAISVAIFFVAERYRLPLLVALCIPAGATLAELPQAFRRRTSHLAPRPSTALALVIAGVVITALPFTLEDGRFEERLRLSKAYMNRHDYAAAVNELQSAHDLKPNDTAAEFNLGMALVSSGRPEEGIAHVRHAVDAGTPVKGARYALAGALLTTGDREGAVTLLRGYYPADDDSAESCYQVARLAMSAGAPRVAERYLQRALQLRPGWPEAVAALEQILR